MAEYYLATKGTKLSWSIKSRLLPVPAQLGSPESCETDVVVVVVVVVVGTS